MEKDIQQTSGSCFGVFMILFLVPFLFVLAVGLGFAGILPLQVDLHMLVTIAVIFVVYLFFIPHNADHAACRVRNSAALMEEDFQDALKANALAIMGKTKSTLTVRDFSEEYFKNIRDDNFARVAPSVFPMLGILGTFIAIAVSMPDFTVSSSDKLDQEISLLLSGIGTAFYASIYGIFLSLWWIFFERKGLARIEKNSLGLEKIYGDRIWKPSELVKHKHTQTELKDQKIIQTLNETFSMDFIKELNTQLIRNYKTIIDDTTHSFEKLTNHLEKVSTDMRTTVAMIHGREESINAVEVVKNDIHQFVQSVDRLEDGLKHFDGTVEGTFEKIDIELASAVDKLAQMAEIIVQQNRQLQDTLHEPYKES